MSRTVHIVALAARSPVGLSAEASAAAVRANISRVREHPFMVDAEGEKLRCGFDGKLEPTLVGAQRMRALAFAALAELNAKLPGLRNATKDLRLFLALPEPRPGFGTEDALLVQRSLMAEGELMGALRVERSSDGHAGGLNGLQRGFMRVASGDDEVCIVAGVDSYLQALTLDWLDADRRLLRAETRAGFAPGEAAAMVVLASKAACRALGGTSLGCLRAVACTHEKRDPTQGAGVLGEALTEAVLQIAGDRIDQRAYVDDVYCDINGERPRVTDWGFTLLRAGTWFRDGSQYVMPAGACGDIGAASALFNVALAVRAWQRGYARGSRAVIWGASWQGPRGAALLERGEA